MLSKTTVILFSGYIGAGKSFIAERSKKYLETRGYVVDVLRFALPLKNCATLFFGWNGIKDERGRKLLQQIGSAGREYDADLWVRILAEKQMISSKNFPQDFILVDDWRYQNEFSTLKEYNYPVYKVRISGEDRETKPDGSAHMSEISLPETNITGYYDFFINNPVEKDTTNLDVLIQLMLDSIISKEDTYK